MKIGILNNKTGNIGSVYKSLEYNLYKVDLIDSPNQIKDFDLIVLCGVGSFNSSINKLKENNFFDELKNISDNKYILGICLGMQMLASKGFEGGETEGLDFIKAEVVKMSSENVKLPHIGWNKVNFVDINPDNLRYDNFYFMHTYHLVPEDYSVVKATCNYGDNKIASIIMKDNVAGFQFHPEKSQGDGLRIIKYVIDKLVS